MIADISNSASSLKQSQTLPAGELRAALVRSVSLRPPPIRARPTRTHVAFQGVYSLKISKKVVKIGFAVTSHSTFGSPAGTTRPHFGSRHVVARPGSADTAIRVAG